MKSKYIVSSISTYDEDEFLYYTKVGIDAEGLPLHYIACGLSEEISRQRAEALAELLNSITA